MTEVEVQVTESTLFIEPLQSATFPSASPCRSERADRAYLSAMPRARSSHSPRSYLASKSLPSRLSLPRYTSNNQSNQSKEFTQSNASRHWNIEEKTRPSAADAQPAAWLHQLNGAEAESRKRSNSSPLDYKPAARRAALQQAQEQPVPPGPPRPQQEENSAMVQMELGSETNGEARLEQCGHSLGASVDHNGHGEEREREMPVAELDWAQSMYTIRWRRGDAQPLVTRLGRSSRRGGAGDAKDGVQADVDLGESNFLSRVHLEIIFTPSKPPDEASADRITRRGDKEKCSQGEVGKIGWEEGERIGPGGEGAEGEMEGASRKDGATTCAPCKHQGPFPLGAFTVRALSKNGVFVDDVFVRKDAQPTPLPDQYASLHPPNRLPTRPASASILFSREI